MGNNAETIRAALEHCQGYLCVAPLRFGGSRDAILACADVAGKITAALAALEEMERETKALRDAATDAVRAASDALLYGGLRISPTTALQAIRTDLSAAIQPTAIESSPCE